MIPHVRDYLPELFKYAQEDVPEVAAPTEVEPPPEKPGMTALKQLGIIGGGLGGGFAAGYGLGELARRRGLTKGFSPYAAGGIGAALGGGASLAGMLMHQARAAELERAKQDYEDYLRRRERGAAAEVQPPPVRT